MNNNLFNNCLSILRTIENDEEKLEMLLEFMTENFEPKTLTVNFLLDYKLQIEEKFRPLVKEAAEYLEMGHIVFVNPQTLEMDNIPKDYYLDFEYIEDLDTDCDFDYKKVENWIKITPPDSRESYKIMELFVENLPNGKEKNKLSITITGHKPFANFNRLIHESDERENWFKFRSNQFEKYVIDNYLEEIQQKYQNKS